MANRFTGGTTITINTKGLDNLIGVTNPKTWNKAQAMALKAAGKTARVQIPKGIGERYTISSARAKQDISNPYISGEAAILKLVSRKPPTALQYRFKPGKRGGPQPGLGRGMGWGKPNPPGRPATTQVFRNRPPVAFPGAFMAKGLPMIRVHRHRGRGALAVLHGPSIGQIYTGRSLFARDLRETTESSISASYVKAFNKVLNDAARGYGAR